MLTPMKSIRAKCLDCSNGSAKEVRLCSVAKCPLYPYRSGHRPKVDTDTHGEAITAKPARSSTITDVEGKESPLV